MSRIEEEFFLFFSTFLGNLLYFGIHKKGKLRLKGQNVIGIQLFQHRKCVCFFVMFFTLSPRTIFFYDHLTFKFSFIPFQVCLFFLIGLITATEYGWPHG